MVIVVAKAVAVVVVVVVVVVVGQVAADVRHPLLDSKLQTPHTLWCCHGEWKMFRTCGGCGQLVNCYASVTAAIVVAVMASMVGFL